MAPAGYLAFLASRKADLQRIARCTRGEANAEDVGQSAWLIACDVAGARGTAIDFLNRDDQELILARLYNQFVAYASKMVRYAVRIDEDPDAEDRPSTAVAIARRLTGPAEADPLVQLEREQDEVDDLDIIGRSYSQASAYLLLLLRFRWDKGSLAEALCITLDTLRRRLSRCAALVQVQPSLFDGIERIDASIIGRYRGAEKLGVRIARA